MDMEDARILNLYTSRSESAVTETARAYGPYCMKIAMNILSNREDAEECVNDAYMHAWCSIPPVYPDDFTAFLGKLTRNLALNLYKQKHAQKRGGGAGLLLSELEECLPSREGVEDALDAIITGRTISAFLYTLSPERRAMFVRRYWFADSIADIARQFHASQSKVKSSLYRTRQELKAYLEREGVTV